MPLTFSQSSVPTLPHVTVKDLLDLAWRAGNAIIAIYGDDTSWVEKADRSPLTTADLASHSVILEGLSTLTPHVPVLSEESQQAELEHRFSWSRYWLVDPLDGTKEFIGRNGEFTVNIALIDQHVPLFGVVHVPANDVTYVGITGIGSFVIHQKSDAHPITVKAPASSVPRIVGSKSHPSPLLSDYLEGLGDCILESIGSSLKFCRIASGASDLYPRLGPTSEWDTAAGQAVLEAAGGHVVDLEGSPLRYNQRQSLINPFFMAFGDPGRDWLAPMRSVQR